MGGQPALAIRCRDPSEFITAVIEHHRGSPLPRNEAERTYLVFIGIDDEDGVFEMIDNGGYLPEPKPNERGEFERDEQSETGEGGEGGDEGGGEGGWERKEKEGGGDDEPRYNEVGEVNEEMASSSEVGDEEGTQSPTVERVRRFPKRIRAQLPRRDGFIDDIHSMGGPEEGGEGADNEEREGEGQGFEEYEDGGEGQEEGEANKSSRYEVIQEDLQNSPQVTHLRPRGNGGQHQESGSEIGEGSGGANYGDGERHDRSNEDAEQKYHAVNQDEDGKPGEPSGVEGKTVSEDPGITVGRTKISAVYKSHYPHTILQGEKARPPAPPPLDISSMSSPLSSLSPEEEEEPTEAIKTYMGQEESSEVDNKTRKAKNNEKQEIYDEIGIGGEAEKKEREKDGEGEGECYAAIKGTPRTPTHRQFLLPIREPSSPISPYPDEISPLTTLKHPQEYEEDSQEIFKGQNYSGDENFHGAEESQIETEGSGGNEGGHALYPEPALEILAAAENVDIIYISDLKGLRIFLHVLQCSPETTASYPPLLAIWGLVGAHHSSSEFSGEGIGNTLSLAVDGAVASGRLLVLGEGYVPLNEDEWDELGEQEKSWIDVDVPILNRESMIMGGTVVVKDILRRWCRFGEDFE